MESSSIRQGGHGDLGIGAPGKASTATRIKLPYPPEFGQEAVRLVRGGEEPLACRLHLPGPTHAPTVRRIR